MRRLSQGLAPGLAGLLLILPWVHPVSNGPAPNAWPWLVSAACLAGVLLLRQHLRVTQALQALLVAALISSAMAVAQYAGLAHQLPGVWPVGPGEAFGNLRQRNQFGSLTALGLACLLGLQAATATDPMRRRRQGLGAWLALGLLALGNAASQSRTGFLAWVLVALLWAWFCARHLRPGLRLALAALPLVLLLAVLLPWLLQAWGAGPGCPPAACGVLGRLAQSGEDSRLLLWRNVLSLIAQRPWTGWGWGELDYAHFITLFEGPRFTEKLGHAHNLPLHLAVELGLPVALLACAGVLVSVMRARPWAETDALRWTAWAVLAVLALHSLLEFPLWYGPFQITLLLAVAFLWRSRPGKRPAAPSPAWAWPEVAAVGLLGLVAVLSLDYLRVSQPFLPPAQRSAYLSGHPLAQAQAAWWFRQEAGFATLVLTPLHAGNAEAIRTLALEQLHHSPEPVVIEKLLDSAALLGLRSELAFYARRYQAAYPAAHAHWLARQPGLSGGARAP